MSVIPDTIRAKTKRTSFWTLIITSAAFVVLKPDIVLIRQQSMERSGHH